MPMKRFLFLTCLFSVSLAAGREFTAAERLFALKVEPILSEKCHGCHGADPEKVKGGFTMLTRADLLAGGDEIGPDVLVPGDAEKSFLMDTIRWTDPHFEMPPKENDRLTAVQIDLVREWIDAGAPWLAEAELLAIREAEARQTVTAEGMIVKTSGGLDDGWTYRRYRPEDIWAFLPYEKPPLPRSSGPEKGTTVHPVDAFLRVALDEAGFEPAPRADPLTLIRRITYDLTGLPPTYGEIRSFRSDWSRDPELAWTNLVDRLLASPRYGERQAQHWFDVARYADTGGMSNDYERSNAWRYRDYVIRSFNEDRPYDRFVMEQLAGDELADASLRTRHAGESGAFVAARTAGDYTPDEAEMIVATGFLRMGPWDPAMVKNPEARQLYLDDVVNSVGQTFLSTTMRCVKCHDHKFDPIPTRDYYRMYAAFAATQMAERPVPFLPEENLEGFEESRAMTERLLEYARQRRTQLTDKREAAAREWYRQNGIEYVAYADRKDLPDEEKPPRHVGLTTEEQGRLKVREQDEWIWNRRLERYEPLAQSVYNGPDPKQLNARRLRMPRDPDLDWRPGNHILLGGALAAPGEPVGPGVLSAPGVPVDHGSASAEDPYRISDEIEGRRLAFARWVVDPRNPLTARSIVNRIWQQHFVRPIAGNPNNFGASGKKPTHPELLDWLAADFVEHGWSLKRLHRIMVTSSAYRQASHHPQRESLAVVDPGNALLAYYPVRRLTAEELRDSLLAITGELESTAGGLPIRPEINREVALQPRMIQFSLAPAYLPDVTPERRNRRTIYAYRVRGLADPFLELFNQPNPNDACEMRDSAAVSPQAFTLLNSDTITDRSIALAAALRENGGDSRDWIDRAFRGVLGRAPDTAEAERLADYFDDMAAYHAGTLPAPRDYPTTITRSLVEEFSGEVFSYEEILPAHENYRADLQASDVDAETRALADVCLLLFNTNEFIYLY